MTTTYFIAGAAFFIASIAYGIFKWIKKRNDANEKAKKDIDSAIDARDWNALDQARMKLK